jgi:eukaryotic-like serine/threonine-protein kinase
MSQEPGSPTQLQRELANLQAEFAPDLQVIRHMGSGSAAEVFLARDIGLGRLVAVKVLSPRLVENPVALARFRREAKAAASLDHPNAVAVHRTGTLSTGVPYLVMQFVKGRTLEEKLEAEGPLSTEEARRILSQVAAALAAAHQQGFVHRDVRPNNVLCDEEGGGRVLVADFGLAGILPYSDRTDPGLTRPGEVLGDLRYLSPEQVRGESPTEGTDVYSLGVMGYEILTGKGPYPSKPGRGPGLPDLGADPIPLASLRPDVDPHLASILERCLSKQPPKRPSAAFVAEALARGADAAAAQGGIFTSPAEILNTLLQRRVPQIVVITFILGVGALSVFGNLADRDIIPETLFRLVLSTVLCLLAASWIVAWFHGEKGKQKVPVPEVLLLVLVAVVWVVLGVVIVMAS